MKKDRRFDKTIKSKYRLGKIKFRNFAEIIFKDRSKEDGKSLVLIGHKKDWIVKTSLKELRFAIANCYGEFKKKKIAPGDTVFLGDLTCSTEYHVAIMLLALVSYGARVFFPFFVEKSELEAWVNSTETKHIILPRDEITALKGHKTEKEVIQAIQKTGRSKNIPIYDLDGDFGIEKFIRKGRTEKITKGLEKQIEQAINTTSAKNEAIIFTTSGTSGRSKLVLFDQGAYLKGIASWEASGLYERKKMGNRNLAEVR